MPADTELNQELELTRQQLEVTKDLHSGAVRSLYELRAEKSAQSEEVDRLREILRLRGTTLVRVREALSRTHSLLPPKQAAQAPDVTRFLSDNDPGSIDLDSLDAAEALLHIEGYARPTCFPEYWRRKEKRRNPIVVICLTVFSLPFILGATLLSRLLPRFERR